MNPTAARADWIAVIPAFRESAEIAAVVAGVRAHGIRVIVVDDGSPDDTSEAARRAGADVVRHPRNCGKGAALRTGFARAREAGCAWILTLDADGQHDPADIPAFVTAAAQDDCDALVGNRMRDLGDMPLLRRWTNRAMSRWISRAAGQTIPDSQCGFRAYRAAVLDNVSCRTDHFEMETEILIRLARRGCRIVSVPIRTIYRAEQSKIRPVRDTLRFWRMWRMLRETPHR